MNDYYDEPVSQGDAYREMVKNVGMDRSDEQWILTPYDTWEKNPAYCGPDQPHPEDDQPYELVEPEIAKKEDIDILRRLVDNKG